MLADNVEALLEAGLKAYGNNDATTAARCWRRVLELQPENEQAKDFLLTAGLELSEPRPAQEPPLAQVLHLDPGRHAHADDPRAALRARVEKLVKHRQLEEALDELDRARSMFPEDASISRSVRLLRDRLVFEYSKRLGRLDDIPRLKQPREVIAQQRPSIEELALIKLIDGIASLGDLVRGSQLGRFETYRAFVRFVERGWIDFRAPSGTWNPRDYLPPETFALANAAAKPATTSSLPPPHTAPSPIEERAPIPSVAPVERKSTPDTGRPTSKPTADSKPPADAKPEDPFDAMFREATAAYVSRDYPKAIELFTRCLALRPDDRSVQHNLQRLQSRRGP
jgi:tetratricopeptide (TPR) repeat protein